MNLQEQISRIKGMIRLISENDIEDREEKTFISNSEKYDSFKKRWIPSHGEGDLDIDLPFEFKVHLFPDEKGFYLELYYNNNIVGNFHSYIDEEEGMMNDTMISPNYRNKGLGKILLVKAMDVSYSYLGGFEPDRRGVMSQQSNVYDSLIKNDIINNNYDINYDKAQEMINSIVRNYQ